MFVGLFPALDRSTSCGWTRRSPRSSPRSSSTPLIIVALVPLALRGVRYTPASASALLRRNVLVYGLGGLVLPFVGIKLIDLFVCLIPGIA